MAGIRLAEQPRVMHKFTLSAMDMDSLLVAFLSELVYYAEQDHLAFDQFDLKLSVENCLEYCLCVELQGAPILSLDKAIKAVTYHNLQIRQKAQRYETEIVFDV